MFEISSLQFHLTILKNLERKFSSSKEPELVVFRAAGRSRGFVVQKNLVQEESSSFSNFFEYLGTYLPRT